MNAKSELFAKYKKAFWWNHRLERLNDSKNKFVKSLNRRRDFLDFKTKFIQTKMMTTTNNWILNLLKQFRFTFWQNQTIKNSTWKFFKSHCNNRTSLYFKFYKFIITISTTSKSTRFSNKFSKKISSKFLNFSKNFAKFWIRNKSNIFHETRNTIIKSNLSTIQTFCQKTKCIRCRFANSKFCKFIFEKILRKISSIQTKHFMNRLIFLRSNSTNNCDCAWIIANLTLLSNEIHIRFRSSKKF